MAATGTAGKQRHRTGWARSRYQPRWRWYSATSSSSRSRLSAAAGSLGSGVFEKALGQRVFRRRPAGQQIELPLGGDDAPGGLAQFVGGHVPAGDAPQHVGGLGVEILEHAAQELAEDQRVHQRRLVLGLDGVAHGVERRVPAIDLVREVDLVGAAAIVIGAARADGEARAPSSAAPAARSRESRAP